MNGFYGKFGDKIFPGQVELIDYLRDNGFAIFVVSGGPKWLAEEAAKRWFKIPPENVIGVQTKIVDGVLGAEIVPPVPFREGKIKTIETVIGKERLLIVAGNTGSDVPMLELAQLLQICIHSFGPETPGFHYHAEQELIAEAGKRKWLMQGF